MNTPAPIATDSANPISGLVRPQTAQQSWKVTVVYCFSCFLVEALSTRDLFNQELAMMLIFPASAYYLVRTGDKFASAWALKSGGEKS